MKSVGARIFHPVFRPTLPDPAELIDEIRSIMASGRVTVGERVDALEGDVCARTGVKHAIAVSSGTSALMLLIRALDLPHGSEVITPSFTFAATAHALLWNCLKPVFCDSEPDSFTMDASAAETLVTERTSAIYPVCIFGVPGDLDSYERLAEKRGLALLYDTAQGLGGTYRGKPLGNFGAGEAFSMSPTKVVTAMEGGLITTNDGDLADRLRSTRDYGKAPDGEDMRHLGLSARMGEVNAAVARWSLARLDTWIANRTALVECYHERLADISGITFQQIPSCCTSSRNYTVILIHPEESPLSRNELHLRLKQRRIQTKRCFYPALHNQTLYRSLEPGCPARLPVAERISARSLALPLYSHMSRAAVHEIRDQIAECFDRADRRRLAV